MNLAGSDLLLSFPEYHTPKSWGPASHRSYFSASQQIPTWCTTEYNQSTTTKANRIGTKVLQQNTNKWMIFPPRLPLLGEPTKCNTGRLSRSRQNSNRWLSIATRCRRGHFDSVSVQTLNSRVVRRSMTNPTDSLWNRTKKLQYTFFWDFT